VTIHSNVAKYKLDRQVQNVGGGNDGWWVVEIQANDNSAAGPGSIVISDTRSVTTGKPSVAGELRPVSEVSNEGSSLSGIVEDEL
jgi:hypothetical protein